MTSPRKQHAASAAAAAAANSQTTAASSNDAAAAAASSSSARSTRGSPPAPAAPAAPSSSQLLSPTTPFSSQSSLPPTPSSQGGGGSSRAGGGGSSSVDPSGFSNLQYLFGSNSALWDEEDEDDDEEFVPNATDMADPDGLAGLEGIEEEMEPEVEEATPHEAGGSRAESPASSQGGGGGGGGGSQRVGRASHIARRTRAHMPLHGVRLEDLESHLTSSVLDWDTAHARMSDMGSSLLSPNPNNVNPLASPLPPRSPMPDAAASGAPSNGRHPELPAGMIDHSASTPSLTPGGVDPDQDREYQNFLRLLAGGGDGSAKEDDGAPDDDDDDDEEFEPGDAGLAEEEAEEEEYRNDRSVSISKKELRSLRNESGEPLPITASAAAAAAASSSRVMSTRRKEQQQQQAAASSSSSAAAAAHHPQTRSAAGASAMHLAPPAPTTRSRQKGSSASHQQQQQPDFFASAHSSIPSQVAMHTRRKPSQHDLQQSQSTAAEQMEDTQPQPSQSDGSARSAGSDLYLSMPTLPVLPNFSFGGFSDGNPLNNASSDSAAAAASAVSMMPSTAAAGLAQLAPLLQMLQQSIAAITAAPPVAPVPVAPPPPKPVVLPRADFTDAQRHTLVSQLNEHVQLLVQVRYLSLNSVLTPVPRPIARKSKKTAEDEEDSTAAAASAAADVEPPLMSLKQIWDKSGDLLTELWQKRGASLEKHQSSASAATSSAADVLADPFECPAPASSMLPNRPLLSLVPLLDVWKGLSEGPELQATHAEMVRQQEPHIPEAVKKQANNTRDAAARALIKAEIEAAEAAASSAANAAEASSSGAGSRFRRANNRHGWCYTPLLRRFLRADVAAPQIRPRFLPAIQIIYRKPLWTPAEDALLDRGYRAFGASKTTAGKPPTTAPDWPRIKHRFLPARGLREIRTRFQNLRTSSVHPFNSATDSPFQKHLLRAELTEQEIEEQLAEDLLDDEAYAEKKEQEQQTADERRALLRHLREEEQDEPHPLQSSLHSSLFEEPEIQAPVAAAAAAAPPPPAPAAPPRRTLVAVAAAAAAPSGGAASAFAPYSALVAPVPVPATSTKRKSDLLSTTAAPLSAAAAAAALPPVFAATVPIWSAKPVGQPGCLMYEMSAEDTKLLKMGLDYFPETHPTRWSSIVTHFLPHWDRLTLRRAYLRLQRQEKMAAEGKTIKVHKQKLTKKQLKQMQRNANFSAQLHANAQMSAAAFVQYAAATPAPSSLLAVYQRKSLAAVETAGRDEAVIDMTTGFEANKRQKIESAAASAAAIPSANAAFMANMLAMNAPTLLAPVQTLPASNWNVPAAAAAAASSRNDHAAASAASSAAAAAASAEPVFEELDLELEEEDAAPAQDAAPADADADEDEEIVEEESGVVAVPANTTKASAQQVAAAALAASAAATNSSGVAPMQLDGDDTDSETGKTGPSAAAPASVAAIQPTPAKSPSKRILARSAADAIIALRAPDEAASSMAHTRAAAAAASPAKNSAAAARSHSSPEKRSFPPTVALATPRQTPMRTPQKSGLASLAHTSELIHTVPAPLLAPVDKQLQYSEESLAYASSTPLPATSSPSKASRASSRHATPLVMVVTPAPSEEGPATRSLRRTRSPLVAANAAAAVAAATAAASATPHRLLGSLSASASPAASAAAAAAASRPPRAARALAQASLTAAASGRWGVGDRVKSSSSLLGLPQNGMQRTVSDPPPSTAAAASSGSATSSASPATTVPSTPVIAASSSIAAESCVPAPAAASSAAAPSWNDVDDRSILTAAKSFGLEVEQWPAETLQPLLRTDGAAEQRRTEAQIKQRLMSFLTAIVQKLPDA